MLNKILFILIVFLIADVGFSQVTDQIQGYRNDPKGNVQYRKEGIMDGNQVRTLFYNNGEVGHWPDQPSGEWPKGTGYSYLDGVAVLIASEITAPGNNQVVHPLQTSYREWMDKDPSTGEIWGLEPVPGYSNPNQVNDYPLERNSPAINTNPHTWPDNWPVALDLNSRMGWFLVWLFWKRR